MESSYKNDSIRISETIRALRQNKGINQEVLADALSVSTQAVSKWETGASIPDVLMLPRIAGYFGVTTDHIYFGGETPPAAAVSSEPASVPLFPDDGVLRVVQFMGGEMLSAEEAKSGKVIELALSEAAALAESTEKQIVIPTEIHGSAAINGIINGDVKAEGDISCGTVNGNVGAHGSVNCRTVNGGAASGKDLQCTTVNGNIQAAGNVTVEKVVGNVSAGGDIRSADISGDLGDFSKDLGRLGKELGKAFGSFGFGRRRSRSASDFELPFPDDGALRVVQFVGTTPFSWRESDGSAIPLEIQAAEHSRFDVYVYGNAEISGTINGSVTAEGTVSCESVGGNVTSDGDVSCVSVGGSITADGDISCCNVEGNATADGDVECNNVGGNVTADGDVECNDVNGNVISDGDVTCCNVGGNVTAEGDVQCGDIGGSVSCEGDLTCGNITGDVKNCEGSIECDTIGGSVRCEGDVHMG